MVESQLPLRRNQTGDPEVYNVYMCHDLIWFVVPVRHTEGHCILATLCVASKYIWLFDEDTCVCVVK
jgi:hypothetical protein